MTNNLTKTVFIFAPYLIFPIFEASHKDIFGHILLFKKLGYAVSLIYYYNDELNLRELEDIKNRYSINIFPLKTGPPIYKNKYTAFYQANIHFLKESIKELEILIATEKPEILFFEYARFAYLAKLLNSNNLKILFRSHNFELIHDYEKDNLNRERGITGFYKMIRHSWKKWTSIYHNEKLMFEIASDVLCISYKDMLSFKKYYNASNISYLPPYLPNIPKNYIVKKSDLLNVVYMGSNFSNNVNYSGAIYLLENIIPLLKKKGISDKFAFHITGKGSEKLHKFNNGRNVILHGFIPDIYSFLERMDVSCLPVKAGRGCKIKMFESLKMGIPTIGFKKTFGGIPFAENCYETAETPKQFVDALIKMMSVDHRKCLSINSKLFISNIASGNTILDILQNVL